VTIFAGEVAPRPSRDSIQTLVAVRRDGQWQWMLFGIADKLFRR